MNTHQHIYSSLMGHKKQWMILCVPKISHAPVWLQSIDATLHVQLDILLFLSAINEDKGPGYTCDSVNSLMLMFTDNKLKLKRNLPKTIQSAHSWGGTCLVCLSWFNSKPPHHIDILASVDVRVVFKKNKNLWIHSLSLKDYGLDTCRILKCPAGWQHTNLYVLTASGESQCRIHMLNESAFFHYSAY